MIDDRQRRPATLLSVQEAVPGLPRLGRRLFRSKDIACLVPLAWILGVAIVLGNLVGSRPVVAFGSAHNRAVEGDCVVCDYHYFSAQIKHRSSLRFCVPYGV